MAIAIVLHALFAVIWVGGMFFAWLCLRPAASALEPAVRQQLWAASLGRYFPWIIAAVVIVLGSGFYMISLLGGMGVVSPWVHGMLGLGIVMSLLFLHVLFAPFKRLKRAVAAGDTAAGGKQLGQLRVLVGLNLLLGLLAVIAGALASLYPIGI